MGQPFTSLFHARFPETFDRVSNRVSWDSLDPLFESAGAAEPASRTQRTALK